MGGWWSKYFLRKSDKFEVQTLLLAVFPHQLPEDSLFLDLVAKENEYIGCCCCCCCNIVTENFLPNRVS